MTHLTVQEWGRIAVHNGTGPAPQRALTRGQANALLLAARSHPLANRSGTNILVDRYSEIWAQQVVGVIAAQGCSLEILPKIDAASDENDETIRTRLVSMLDVALEGGRERFQTTPDILIKGDRQVVMVIDTKWKMIGQNPEDKKRGVSQSDVYQMMVYARLYHCRQMMLLYRRRFPGELVVFIQGGNATGRKELKVSLRAKDIKTPGAMDRYTAAERDFAALVVKARKLATGTFDTLELVDQVFLMDNYVAKECAVDEAFRSGYAVPDRPYTPRRDLEGDYDELARMLNEYDTAGIADHLGDWTWEYADALGYNLDRRAETFPRLCVAMAEAICRLWVVSIEPRLGIDIDREPIATETPPAPFRPAKSHPQTPGALAVGESCPNSPAITRLDLQLPSASRCSPSST